MNDNSFYAGKHKNKGIRKIFRLEWDEACR
jgi:hypothetical protein